MRVGLLVAAVLLGGCRGKDVGPSPPPKLTSLALNPAPPAGPPAAWIDGQPEPDTGKPIEGGTLVVRSMVEPGGLNFLVSEFHDGWTSRMTRNLVFESLLEIDPSDYSLKPQLATAWAESPDHLTQTFKLRSGVVFHDGSPFTANDVVAVLKAVKNPKLPTDEVRADFVDLDSFKAIDDLTVELKWKKASFLALRQLARLPIYPAKSLDGDFEKLPLNRAPIGTGPFKFESWDAGQKLTLTRFDGYWGLKPHLDTIVFRFIKDHTLAALLAERGELDLFTQVQPTVWRSLEANGVINNWAQHDFNRIRAPENSTSSIAWNETFKPFQSVKVRQALAMCYPAELISKQVDLGLELPTTCPYFIGSSSCDPAVKPFPFDPKAARALLESDGWAANKDGVMEKDGQKLEFEVLIPAASVRMNKLLPLMQQELKKAGVSVTIDKADPAVIDERVDKRDFQAVARGWTEFDAVQDLYPNFHSSQAKSGANDAGLKDPEVDKLLEQIRQELDPAKRIPLERTLHAKLYQLQPNLLMTVRQTLDLAKKRVHGLSPSLVWYDLRKVWVDPVPKNVVP